jgi:hypothetical protein
MKAIGLLDGAWRTPLIPALQHPGFRESSIVPFESGKPLQVFDKMHCQAGIAMAACLPPGGTQEDSLGIFA